LFNDGSTIIARFLKTHIHSENGKFKIFQESQGSH